MNYKRIYFTIVFVVSSAYILSGQNLFVSNIKNNLVFANPSFAALNNFSIIQTNYRNQWPVDGIYNTYGASVFQNIEDLNSNIGLVLNYDRQLNGIYNNYTLGINYAYKLKVSPRNYLFFGLFGAYNFQKIDYSTLVYENPSSTYQENVSRSLPSFNLGITYYRNQSHAFGISFVNLYSFTDTPLIEQHLNLSYLGKFDLRRNATLISAVEPIGNIRLSQSKVESRLGCNLEFYNFRSGVLLNFGNIHLNSSSFLLGVFSETYDLTYCYEVYLSKSVTINPKMAAHEVTFLWKYQYKRRRKHHRAIKCPDI